MQQRFSAIQLFCLFETSVRAERTLVRTERTDVTRSCADNGCRKIEAVFCNSPLNYLYYVFYSSVKATALSLFHWIAS